MSRYEGGLGTRENGDLIRWTLEIEEFLRQERMQGGYSIAFRERLPEATLTLHDINKPECEAVIALLNEMRSASRGVVIEPSRYPSIGARFAGLEFE